MESLHLTAASRLPSLGSGEEDPRGGEEGFFVVVVVVVAGCGDERGHGRLGVCRIPPPLRLFALLRSSPPEPGTRDPGRLGHRESNQMQLFIYLFIFYFYFLTEQRLDMFVLRCLSFYL